MAQAHLVCVQKLQPVGRQTMAHCRDSRFETFSLQLDSRDDVFLFTLIDLACSKEPESVLVKAKI